MVMDMRQDSIPANEYIGKRIERARNLIGWTQTKLGDAIGLHQEGVSNIEKGKRAVSAYELGKIATALGQPLRFFYGEPGTTEPVPGNLDFRLWPVAHEHTRINGEPGGIRTHDTRIKSQVNVNQTSTAQELASII